MVQHHTVSKMLEERHLNNAPYPLLFPLSFGSWLPLVMGLMSQKIHRHLALYSNFHSWTPPLFLKTLSLALDWKLEFGIFDSKTFFVSSYSLSLILSQRQILDVICFCGPNLKFLKFLPFAYALFSTYSWTHLFHITVLNFSTVWTLQ